MRPSYAADAQFRFLRTWVCTSPSQTPPRYWMLTNERMEFATRSTARKTIVSLKRIVIVPSRPTLAGPVGRAFSAVQGGQDRPALLSTDIKPVNDLLIVAD